MTSEYPSSRLWSYFTKDLITGHIRCVDCKESIGSKNDITSEMTLHLQERHTEKFNQIYKLPVCQKDGTNVCRLLHEDQIPHRQLNEIEYGLLKAIAEFWKEQRFTDIDIHCGRDSKVIKAHSLVLGSISPLIKQAIEAIPNIDIEDAVILIPDLNSELLLAFLDRIYNGSEDEVVIPSELQFLNIGPGFSTNKKPRTKYSIVAEKNSLDEDSNKNFFRSTSQQNYISNETHQVSTVKNANRKNYWKYYANMEMKTADDEDCYECILCGNIFPGSYKNSKQLLLHIKRDHNDIFRQNLCPSKRKRMSSLPSETRMDIHDSIMRDLNCDAKNIGSTIHENNEECKQQQYVKENTTHNEDMFQINPTEESDNFLSYKDPKQLQGGSERRRMEINKISKKLRKDKEKQLVMFSKQKGPRVGTPSIAWNFFELVNPNAAKCLICEVLVTTTFSSTSGLLKHLKSRHLEFCERWEIDNVQNFDHSILDDSETHPIHQHFKKMEKGTWSCNYCDTVFLGIETFEIQSLNDHLKEYHMPSFKDYELEKVAILCRKKKAKRSQLTVRNIEADSSPEKLKEGQIQPNSTTNVEKLSMLLKTGLSNILASDFFFNLDKNMMQCNLCSGTVRLKTAKTSHVQNLSANLWKHLKISHFDIYEQLEREQSRISQIVKIYHKEHPIWKYFCESKINLFQCKECNREIELSGLQIESLENHLSSCHHQSYLSLQSKDEAASSILDNHVWNKCTPGLPKMFKSFFKNVGNFKFRCKECKNGSNMTESEMAGHVVLNHNKVLSDKLKVFQGAMDPEGAKIYVNLGECFCTKCDPVSIFASSTALESHDRYLHLGERPYQCNQCNRSFIRSDELKLHKRYHEDRETKKGAMCSQCGMVFNSSASRIRHENTVHYNIRKHCCKCCSKKFASSQALERHSRIHSELKPHQCSECGQQFREVAHLKVHFRTHSGEKPISCPYCSLTFKHYAGRRSHKCEGKLLE